MISSSLLQVSKVVYPALPDHPYFPRVQKLMGGQAGGVVSFELTGGAPAADLMFQVQPEMALQIHRQIHDS